MLVLFAIAAIGCGEETGDKTNGSGIAGAFGGTGGVAGTAPSGGTGGTAGTGTPAGSGGTAGTAGVGGTAGTAGAGATGGTGGTAGTASGGTGAAGMAGMTGGAGGTAGTASGGTGGAGGTGGTAGNWAEGEACADNVLANAPEGSTSPECAACLCDKCPTELNGCYPADNATWSGQCRALVQCGRMAPCCGTACYGDYDFATMTGNGPCVQEVYDAGGGKAAVEGFPGSCSMFGPPPANACAASNRFGLCTATNCKAECSSPCNPADFGP